MKNLSIKFKINFYFSKQYLNSPIRKYYSNMESNKKKWNNPLDSLKDKCVFRTGLQVNNSLTNQRDEFVTKDGSRTVNWYMCGPTVYDSAHLGHARTYVGFDILRRIMTNYFGYDVVMCMNITDIDDKIINRSNEVGIEFKEFTKMWEEDFFKDMKALNVMYPTYITRVTEYVPEVISFIQKLIDKKYAYVNNESVYFDIDEYKKNVRIFF
jgi:cysteinyl-tRNA synthetase